ncbi:MAG: type II/IV secretion system protein [Candidatus Vogelbacteria bacterium]|nr:type II/IV secretion system protein [Candidatus Vogelbacteria bacterium]
MVFGKEQTITVPVRQVIDFKIPFEVLKYVPEETAQHYKFVPLGLADGMLDLGFVKPDDVDARGAAGFISSKSNIPFKIFQISEDAYTKILDNYKGLVGQIDTALGQFDTEMQERDRASKELQESMSQHVEVDIIEEAPVSKIVAVIIQHATEGNASDIHIEPLDKRVRVRFRVDGDMNTSLFLPLGVHDAVVARIKILANIKIDEKRRPQDGRFSAVIENRAVDFRVSTLPTFFGEKVEIRILDQLTGVRSLEQMGMGDSTLATVKRALDKPYGMILVTGPTGSGKSTTLYAMLNSLDKDGMNIVTLEDPVEYNIPGINQSQVHPEIEYTFAEGLRSILRQDPDVIMVGEIRDKETAQLAIQAALTGHLVLSTLHTNTAVGAISRLVDMGVDPYLIAPTLILSIGQRLSRKLCEEKEVVPIDDAIRLIIDREFSDLPAGIKDQISKVNSVCRPKKSTTCATGVRGRIGVYEALEMDRDLEGVILKTPQDSEIYKVARAKGMLTIKEDAIIKSMQGLIPFEEAMKF